MHQPENAALNGITDAEHDARLERMARMIKTSPWPEQPEPPPKPEPLYHVERYGDRHFAAYEGKNLLA
jgi:hypothetical protein